MEQMIFSVSEANLFIKTLLEQVPQLKNIYVRGEISNYKLHYSGHHYITLKDNESVLKAVMFKGAAQSLTFVPDNG
ncbi:MAG: exodeoxyribonuclease VII large subunit, partial [Oscillospiraceae bacterium]|nr:exodeoxyribonuclease VII large subunit [Oscillospiraceae bacterium]